MIWYRSRVGFLWNLARFDLIRVDEDILRGRCGDGWLDLDEFASREAAEATLARLSIAIAFGRSLFDAGKEEG